ncbi:MAG TPA: hypothetical protein VK797_08395 [Tepidisphaeraceae bacterium]|jgi:hypothetical protein|nr:hypothetical protein [Tepidisphaeraceae bacterium]
MAFAHAQLVPAGSREIRVGADAWEYGDPYDWCCIAKPTGRGTVELSLVTTPPTRRQAWAVVRLLRSLGFRQILVRRVVDGRERVVRHPLHRGRTSPSSAKFSVVNNAPPVAVW